MGLCAVVSQGGRVRSRRVGAERAGAGGRAVRRVRDVRRDADGARRSGAGGDGGAGERRSRVGARVAERAAAHQRKCVSGDRDDGGGCAGGLPRGTIRRARRAPLRVECVAGLQVRGGRVCEAGAAHALSDVGHGGRARAVQAGRRHDVGTWDRARAHDVCAQVAGVDLGTVRLPAGDERAPARSGGHRVPDDGDGRRRLAEPHFARGGAHLHLRHPRQQRMAVGVDGRGTDVVSDVVGAESDLAGAGGAAAGAGAPGARVSGERSDDCAGGQRERRPGAARPRRPRAADRHELGGVLGVRDL